MNKRDLKADLEMCNKATPGPWEWNDYSDFDYKTAILNGQGDEVLIVAYDSESPDPCPAYIDETCKENDLKLMVQAREGWPHAIERAIKAEALARELVGALEEAIQMLENYADQNIAGLIDVLDRSKEVLD